MKRAIETKVESFEMAKMKSRTLGLVDGHEGRCHEEDCRHHGSGLKKVMGDVVTHEQQNVGFHHRCRCWWDCGFKWGMEAASCWWGCGTVAKDVFSVDEVVRAAKGDVSANEPQRGVKMTPAPYQGRRTFAQGGGYPRWSLLWFYFMSIVFRKVYAIQITVNCWTLLTIPDNGCTTTKQSLQQHFNSVPSLGWGVERQFFGA